MSVKKFIRDHYRQGQDLVYIKDKLVGNGFDEMIVDAEIDIFRRNRTILYTSGIVFMLLAVSSVVMSEPSVTGGVVQVKIGKAIINITDAITSSNVLYILIGICVVIALYFFNIILHKHKIHYHISPEGRQGVVVAKEVRHHPSYVDMRQTEHDWPKEMTEHKMKIEPTKQVVQSSVDRQVEQKPEKNPIDKLVYILQTNYDAGISLHRLHRAAKAKGWKEEAIGKAISRLKVKGSDEILKEEL